MSATRSQPLRERAREDGRGEAATKAGKLAAFLQRAAGFVSRQAFLAGVAPFCGLPDASAVLFRRLRSSTGAKNANRVLQPPCT